MRRTNKIILMTLMISLLLLGIGYAAIQNITLSISGFAEVGAKADNFNVRFLETVDITKNGFDNVIVDAQKTSDVTATINLSGLSKAGETITALYTVKNASPDLSADLTVSTTNDAPEYLTISSQLDKTSIVAGEETTVEVIVEVTKTPISENIRAQIGVELIAMPVQPGEEGTSEGIKDFDQTPNSDGKNEYGYYYDRFYCNEELGYGLISHADYSCEFFYLVRAEENSKLTKDEWICAEYYGPGEMDPKEEIKNGMQVLDDGKTIINYNIEFSLSDIIPHGIHLNNIYTMRNDNGIKETDYIFREDGIVNWIQYNSEEVVSTDISLKDYFKPKANGYCIVYNNEILISFNITGELLYANQTNEIFYIEEFHDYVLEKNVEANCTDNGYVQFKCNDCYKKITLSNTVQNHRNDYNLDSICDDCGAEIIYEKFSFNFTGWNLLVGNSHELNYKDLVIPSYVYSPLAGKWYEIDGIWSEAFLNNSEIESITIPVTVTEIERDAFKGCNSLKTVNFMGTEEQAAAIVIEEGNDVLNNVTINFNYVIPTE